MSGTNNIEHLHMYAQVYSEVDSMECLLHYKSYNAGFCKILIHPKFGSAVYPATIFAHAPCDIVIALLQQYPDANYR